MPALIDLRRRIKSVRNTQKITQAMKTVATAKFKKAQRAVLEGRPSWHSYPELLSRVTAVVARSCHPLLEKREEKTILGIVMTSDKGLAGAFNSNLLEKANSFLERKSSECRIRLILIGKKAALYFRNRLFAIERSFSDYGQKMPSGEWKTLAEYVIRDFVLLKSDAVYVFYNEFKSILTPRVTVSKLLPLEPPAQQILPEPEAFDWDPKCGAILNTLLPFYIEDQLRHFFFESEAAEHAARMMAMENATNNAEDLIADLTLFLNKMRQASITTELLEIMSAVEALGR